MNPRTATSVLAASQAKASVQSLIGWVVVSAGTLLIAADWLHALH